MQINVETDSDHRALILTLTGSFDFQQYKQFNKSYTSYDPLNFDKFVICLEKTTFMDSTALGSLLVFHEWATNNRKKNKPRFILRCGSETLCEMVTKVHLDKIYEIERGSG